MVDIRGWDVETGRSVASVTWADGTTNVYRVGHKGKVDLKCVCEAPGGFYYKEHLPRLGEGCPPAPAGAGPGGLCGGGGVQGGEGRVRPEWGPPPASRQAGGAAAPGECGRPALPARGQGDVPAGHRHPEGAAGRPRQGQPQDGGGEPPRPRVLRPPPSQPGALAPAPRTRPRTRPGSSGRRAPRTAPQVVGTRARGSACPGLARGPGRRAEARPVSPARLRGPPWARPALRVGQAPRQGLGAVQVGAVGAGWAGVGVSSEPRRKPPLASFLRRPRECCWESVGVGRPVRPGAGAWPGALGWEEERGEGIHRAQAAEAVGGGKEVHL